jgi:hypothetical protein
MDVLWMMILFGVLTAALVSWTVYTGVCGHGRGGTEYSKLSSEIPKRQDVGENYIKRSFAIYTLHTI